MMWSVSHLHRIHTFVDSALARGRHCFGSNCRSRRGTEALRLGSSLAQSYKWYDWSCCRWFQTFERQCGIYSQQATTFNEARNQYHFSKSLLTYKLTVLTPALLLNVFLQFSLARSGNLFEKKNSPPVHKAYSAPIREFVVFTVTRFSSKAIPKLLFWQLPGQPLTKV